MAIKKQLGMFLEGFARFGLVVMFAVGVSLFWVGFHNSDLGWNMRVLEAVYNTSLTDTGIDFVERTGIDGILVGGKQMLQGFLIALAAAYSLGSVLARIRL